PEALAEEMHEQGGCLSHMSDEGGIFDIMAGRYSKNPDIDIFLKSYQGSPKTVKRKGAPAIHLRRPLLTIGIAIQPRVLEQIKENPVFVGKGLPHRFLWSMSPNLLGQRDPDPPEADLEAVGNYRQCIRSLLQVQ